MVKGSKAQSVPQLGVIYARYSSHNQKDASIEQQIEECSAYAAEAGITIIETYEDRAISGKSDNRPAFQRLLKDAEARKFQYVVSWKSNRIGRNMMQALVNESRLRDAGVKCLYTEEDFDDSAAGRFALRSMMNVNEFYSEAMAEDIRRGLMDNASKCMLNGKAPYGYKKDADGRYAIDEAEAEIVREIYTKFACGTPQADISASLNMRGIKTSTGGEWGKSSFYRLLTNERYRGVYIYKDTRIEGGIPRIVTDDLYYRVQGAMKTKKNPRGNAHRSEDGDYLLTGKLYCGLCKHQMVGMSGRSAHGERALHYYYKCNNKRLNHACSKSNVRRDSIEQAVAQAIRDNVLQDNVIEWIADSTIAYFNKQSENNEVQLLEQQLTDTSRALKNLLSAIEMGIVTETTKSRLMELEAESAQLRSRLSAAKADVVDIDREQIVEVLKLYKEGDIHDKHYLQALFDTFLVAVYVFDDKLRIVFGYSGDKNSVEVSIEASADDLDAVCTDSAKLHQCELVQTPVIYAINGVFMFELAYH